jgi:hypothetical protein
MTQPHRIGPVDAPVFIVAPLADAAAATLLFRWLVPSLAREARAVNEARYFPGLVSREIVAKPYLLTPLGMRSERKQIPQVVENIERR